MHLVTDRVIVLRICTFYCGISKYAPRVTARVTAFQNMHLARGGSSKYAPSSRGGYTLQNIHLLTLHIFNIHTSRTNHPKYTPSPSEVHILYALPRGKVLISPKIGTYFPHCVSSISGVLARISTNTRPCISAFISGCISVF